MSCNYFLTTSILAIVLMASAGARAAGSPCDIVHAAYSKMLSANPRQTERNTGA